MLKGNSITDSARICQEFVQRAFLTKLCKKAKNFSIKNISHKNRACEPRPYELWSLFVFRKIFWECRVIKYRRTGVEWTSPQYVFVLVCLLPLYFSHTGGPPVRCLKVMPPQTFHCDTKEEKSKNEFLYLRYSCRESF